MPNVDVVADDNPELSADLVSLGKLVCPPLIVPTGKPTACVSTSDKRFPMANRLLELTAAITAAFVENNRVSADELTGVISSVHASLQAANSSDDVPADPAPKATAAQIRKSITPDAIISFEDGRPYKSMKRSLARLGLTPAQYREKWGLPADYPMVAPNYSAQRSALARQLGLGRLGQQAKTPAKPSKARGRSKTQ